MNKEDIVRSVYQDLDGKIPMTKIQECLDCILDVIAKGLKEGKEVQLSDFGTFSLTQKSIQPVVKTTKKKK
jgi:nucleoid DNA-binding protein